MTHLNRIAPATLSHTAPRPRSREFLSQAAFRTFGEPAPFRPRELREGRLSSHANRTGLFEPRMRK